MPARIRAAVHCRAHGGRLCGGVSRSPHGGPVATRADPRQRASDRCLMNAAATQRSPDPYHIASHSTHADAAASSYTLNHADTFAVLDRWGDADGSDGASMGLYHRDTRYLSRL